MSLSVFGVIWILVLVFSFGKKIQYTIYLLLFSFVFQSQWILQIGSIDFNASLVTAIAVLIRYFVQFGWCIYVPDWGAYALGYSLYTVAISIVAPHLFDGLIIENMTNKGYDFNIVERYSLGFSGDNLTQPLSILLYVLVAIILYNCKNYVSYRKVDIFFKRMYIFVFIFGMIHVIFMFLNIPLGVLRDVFHNEYQLIGATYFDYYLTGRFARFMSTFYEPSYCGAYLSMCFFYFWKNKKNTNKFYLTSCALALILNMSSTGLGTIMFCMAVSFIKRIYSNRRIKSEILLYSLLAGAMFCGLLILNEEIRKLFYQFTFGKFTTGSYDLRSRLNGYAMDALRNTYGIGVGVNSINSSSLVIALISQLGILGIFVYILFLWKTSKSFLSFTKENYGLVMSCLFASFVSSVLACPALNFGVFWFSICLGALLSKKRDCNMICCDLKKEDKNYE